MTDGTAGPCLLPGSCAPAEACNSDERLPIGALRPEARVWTKQRNEKALDLVECPPPVLVSQGPLSDGFNDLNYLQHALVPADDGAAAS